MKNLPMTYGNWKIFDQEFWKKRKGRKDAETTKNLFI